MSDENKTEQVEEIKTEPVEVKKEETTEQPQQKQVDIDKVVKDRLYRQEQKILNDFKEFLPSSLENQVNHNNFEMRIYAINYNYLVIKSGMGGIQFSN